MGKINFGVRFKNKQFLTSFIALLLVFANQVATLFGYNIELVSMEITNISETVLLILGLMGIINDPTTSGNGLLGDSKQALEYTEPKKDK